MLRLILRGIRARKLRTILTSLAIVLGVAMISGTFVLTNQINGAFNDIFEKANANTDAVVLPLETFDQGNDEEPVALTLPDSLVPKVAAVAGVKAATGFRSDLAYLVNDGKIVKPEGGAPPLFNANPGEPFNTDQLLEGARPTKPGEVALDKTLADREHLKVGDHVQIATTSGLHDATVSGIVKYPFSIGGATIIQGTLADQQAWMDQPGEVTSILAAADPGVSQTELAGRIRQAVGGPGVEVKTGEQDAKDNADDINGQIGGFLTPALLAFGFVAVFVGAFIIFNTFMITVAQRVREFGMLRTLGASRTQLMRAVIGEAFLIGLLASIVGLFGGFLVAAGINGLFNAIGFGLPTRSPTLPVQAVIWSLVVGVLVTVLASTFPAWRATRIPPIAALREGQNLPRGRFARYSWVLAIVIAVLGLALIVQGFSGSGGTSQRLLGMGIGALLVFIAVAMTAKFVVRPVARIVGWPLEQTTGMTGRLARENAMRNPSRTAVTSAALMIGLAIVVFVSVFAAGLKETIASTVKGSIRADLVVQDPNFGRIPGAIVPALQKTDGLTDVAGLFTERVKFGSGRQHSLAGTDPVPFEADWKFKWVDGSADTLANLGANGGVIDKDTAKTEGLKVGSTVTVTTRADKSADFVIKGIYDGSNTFLNGLVVPQEAFDKVSANRDADVVLARADGVSPEQARDNAKATLKSFPVADVQTASEFTQSTQDSLNPIIFLLYALLSLIVIISLFGIVITLVLSIFERTREIGMLRAIGTTRRQLRRMVRYESVITAVIGGLLGIVVGLFFGWVMAKGLESEGIKFVVPWGQLVVFLIVAIIAGVVSAILPARRAARLNVLDALQYE